MTAPVIISICSLVVTIVGAFIAISAYRRKYTETILFEIDLSKKPYQIGWMAGQSRTQLYLITEWECLVVNNGELNVSIIGIKTPRNLDILMQADTIYAIKTATARENHHHEIISIHKQVYFLDPDAQIPLPVRVPAGEGQRFKVKIGLPIGEEVQNRLQMELDNKRIENNTAEIFQFLSKAKLSLSGTPTLQRVVVGLRTARGSIVAAESFFAPVFHSD